MKPIIFPFSKYLLGTSVQFRMPWSHQPWKPGHLTTEHVQVLRARAEEALAGGQKDEAASLEESAREVEGLLQPESDQRFAFSAKWVGDYFESMPILHWLAREEDRKAVTDFSWLAEDSAMRLVDVARSGSPVAIELLAELAWRFTEAVNAIACRAPEAVSATASHRATWPILASSPRQCGKSDPDLKAIRLGSSLPYHYDHSRKFSLDHPAVKIAVELLTHVKRLRHRSILAAIQQKLICKKCEFGLGLPDVERVMTDTEFCGYCGFRLLTEEGKGSGLGGKFCRFCAHRKPGAKEAQMQIARECCELCRVRLLDHKQWRRDSAKLSLRDRAAFLPEFRATTSAEWWAVAKACLIAGYPHKTLRGQLDETTPFLDSLITARSHRKSPKVLRSRILEALEERFSYLAAPS